MSSRDETSVIGFPLDVKASWCHSVSFRPHNWSTGRAASTKRRRLPRHLPRSYHRGNRHVHHRASIGLHRRSDDRVWTSGGWLEHGLTPMEMLIASAWLILFLAFLPAIIVSWTGLLRLRWWAPWLYLGTVAVAALASFPLGLFDFSFQWGLSQAFAELNSIISGAIIALAFFSPVTQRFLEPTQTDRSEPALAEAGS